MANQEIAVTTPRAKQLPSLADLNHDIEQAFKDDQLNLLCNQNPPAKFLKEHPFVNVKDASGKSVALKYLPIDKVEFLLTRIFHVIPRAD